MNVGFISAVYFEFQLKISSKNKQNDTSVRQPHMWGWRPNTTNESAQAAKGIAVNNNTCWAHTCVFLPGGRWIWRWWWEWRIQISSWYQDIRCSNSVYFDRKNGFVSKYYITLPVVNLDRQNKLSTTCQHVSMWSLLELELPQSVSASEIGRKKLQWDQGALWTSRICAQNAYSNCFSQACNDKK